MITMQPHMEREWDKEPAGLQSYKTLSLLISSRSARPLIQGPSKPKKQCRLSVLAMRSWLKENTEQICTDVRLKLIKLSCRWILYSNNNKKALPEFLSLADAYSKSPYCLWQPTCTFALGVPSAWNVLAPDTHMAFSLISIRSFLRFHHLHGDSFFETLF